MDKFIRLLCVLCVFSSLALPLTGCENPPWESGMVLILKVDAPKDGATITTPTVTVSGRVTGTESKAANVSVNEVTAPVKDGKYSADITLNEGKNLITVAARSGQASLNEKVTVTYAPAK